MEEPPITGQHPQFSDEQVEKLKSILLTHERTEWLWATIFVWAKWTAAVITVSLLALNVARDGLKWLLGGHP